MLKNLLKTRYKGIYKPVIIITVHRLRLNTRDEFPVLAVWSINVVQWY